MTINGITTSGGRSDRPGRASVSGNVEGQLRGETLDVILRPSESAADATLDLNSYYNGEIVIPGVKVEPDAGADAALDLDSYDRIRELEKRMQRQLIPQRTPRTGGGSDGNFTAAMGLPTLDGLGVDGEGAHTLEEHLLVSSIERGTLLMQGLFETLE